MIIADKAEVALNNEFDQIREQVREFVIQNFMFGQGGENLSNEASLLDEGILDSTGVMELMLFARETFEFEVEPEELLPENFDSVNNLTAYIARKLAK